MQEILRSWKGGGELYVVLFPQMVFLILCVTPLFEDDMLWMLCALNERPILFLTLKYFHPHIPKPSIHVLN